MSGIGRFPLSNISHYVLTHPLDVYIVINDELAILNITNLTGILRVLIICGQIMRMEAGQKMI